MERAVLPAQVSGTQVIESAEIPQAMGGADLPHALPTLR